MSVDEVQKHDGDTDLTPLDAAPVLQALVAERVPDLDPVFRKVVAHVPG